MTIPVILLNYNSTPDCRKCVSFLKRQEGIDLEIIIVDNASSDAAEARELCQEQDLTFIQADANRGYNAGNNIGLRYAASKGYKYALIANPDMEFPESGYILSLFTELKRHNDVVAIGSDVKTQDGIHQNPKIREKDDWRNSFNWVKELFKSRKKKTDNVPNWVDNPTTSHYCRCLNGCCLMLKMDFLKHIDFFDERVFLYGEEPILGRKIELEGKKMYYYADVSCIHDHKKCKEGLPAFCNRHWRHSQLHYIRHYSHQPFLGRCLAEMSCRLYFTLLNLKHRFLHTS